MTSGTLSDVRLWSNNKEQEKYENLAGEVLQPMCAQFKPWVLVISTYSAHADLFAIIKCTEKLERAYVRDAINAPEYESACEKLIAQFKVLWGSMKNTVGYMRHLALQRPSWALADSSASTVICGVPTC